MDVPTKIVFYDGDCGLCNRFIQFVLKHERKPELSFASLTSALAQEAIADLHIQSSRDTIVFKENDKFYVRSSASLRIAQYLKAPFSWATIFRFVPLGVRDWVYNAIARHRHQLVNSYCIMPDSEHSSRFL